VPLRVNEYTPYFVAPAAAAMRARLDDRVSVPDRAGASLRRDGAAGAGAAILTRPLVA